MQGRNIAEILTGAVVVLVAAVFLAFALGQSGRSLGGGSGGITLSAKFDRIDGLTPGADVRIGGVKVGSVLEQRIDPQTYLAVLRLRVDSGIAIPEDSSAEITSESLLGGKYVALVPGGSETMLRDGQEIGITQSAVSLESLLGRFIFSVTELTSNTARQQEGEQPQGPAPAPSGRP
ncbi:outer membrane lipid asymmetry maintenance protein MlaD [Pseudoroseomonas rhizosphaerae]|uniref:Outer membrane lipid asymmetry maintenance protein MlaD n=1 Tax=Teichococcus rhizosphaerae TaxID=1335062 RepID=A0A2C7A8T6_9PROT|nr:outer membrane lipid asymmetry maintenance protein MlaD [Pseudoroseomonas rhizosphaerae]PHK94033.1 outer membrane lipid asymmetry maintenance protein MlaD [Pseudoroseomonas rhizosphaerae]